MALNLSLSPDSRRRLYLGAVVLAALAAAGCGRRGALEPPPGAAVAPRAAQQERMVAPVAQVTASDFADLDNEDLLIDDRPRRSSAQAPAPAVAPAPADPSKPSKPFLLDALVK